MINFTLKQLRYFEALADHGHFGRASEACAISQPALSLQIKDLEAAVGQPLFERGARQVYLTSFGQEFAQRAGVILRGAQDLGDWTRAAQDGLMGRLRIGVIPTIAPYLLPRFIAHLTKEHADLDVHIRESQTDRLVQEVTDGKLDAAIVALPISHPALQETPLFTEELCLVRHAQDAGKPVPDAQAMAEMRVLLLEEGHCFRDQALSFCNLRPNDGLDGSSLSTLVQMVGAGMGITFIPQMAVPVETPSVPVDVVQFAPPAPIRTIGILWRNSQPNMVQMHSVADAVCAAAQSLGLGRSKPALRA
ncbi:LysR substrate-binding domain-containing protein [Algirhabdus cladophorae]|uniref:hydrogen peroxide-inducible genes activator n=1 Tax=Algirhabdus cladophorae TaxID=3377108 RepID=UPI003B84B3C9